MALHISDALENLNTIIDAVSLDELEITDEAHFVSHRDDTEQYWVRPGPDPLTLEAIKETFQAVFNYLQDFYKKSQSDPKKLIEGFNSIMLLVGEAAKKFDNLGILFKEKVSNLKEFKKLQSFYKNRVVKNIVKETPHLPVEEEEGRAWEEEIANYFDEEIEEIDGVHILDDLEVVKRDHSYELFYLLNESGSHFYSPHLSRNLKLATDFIDFEADDPLIHIKNWEDKSLQLLAKKILTSSRAHIEKFYKEATKHLDFDLVSLTHKALMALMLAANPRNLLRQFSKKGCYSYFADFQRYMRHALYHPEYQRFMYYSPEKEKPFIQPVLDLLQSLCYDLYTIGPDREEISLILNGIIQPTQGNKPLSELLAHSYHALMNTLEKHPHGPLLKTMDLIREDESDGNRHIFDPLMQGNIPERLCQLEMGKKTLTFLRLPSPTIQESIQKAEINPEFTTFISDEGLHLIFLNLQDRTSWQEHARTKAIEEMGMHAQFAKSMTVITLTKNSDFYHQMNHYSSLTSADDFISQFLNHLEDDATGYYFPPKVKKKLFPVWSSMLFQQIHTTFFDNKDSLTMEDRLNFIEIAYAMITLKLIEIIDANFMGLSSKDALDLGAVTMIALIAFLFCDREKSWDIDRLNTILFAPTLMLRERLIHFERFERLYHMIIVLEEKRKYRESFKELFDYDTLNALIDF